MLARARAIKASLALCWLTATGIPLVAFGQVSEATLYYVSWDTEYRVSMTSDRLRQHPDIEARVLRAETRDALLKLLAADSETSTPADVRIRDLRLVVDFTMSDGQIVTFVANRFGVLDPRSGAIRRNDADFRRRLAEVLFECRTCF